jgi:hypothetical protein
MSRSRRLIVATVLSVFTSIGAVASSEGASPPRLASALLRQCYAHQIVVVDVARDASGPVTSPSGAPPPCPETPAPEPTMPAPNPPPYSGPGYVPYP